MKYDIAMQRRTFLNTMAAAAVVSGTAAGAAKVARKGRVKQAICAGVFRGADLDMEGMCREAARLGAVGFDLRGPEHFPVIKKYGLVPTMVGGGSGIKAGLNDKSLHSSIEPKLREAMKATAEAGAPNVIVMAGDRSAASDEEGLDNCALFLKKVVGQAEDLGVTLCMELLNSKVNHPGYMCDHTAWGVELCKRVGSPRFKLLYDIYHMQIMEGDIIRTIRDNIQYIGHFHTAGNPGRNQMDETQELYYPPIMKAIVETGFDGYVAHEYTPTKDKDPVKTLDEMLTLCDV